MSHFHWNNNHKKNQLIMSVPWRVTKKVDVNKLAESGKQYVRTTVVWKPLLPLIAVFFHSRILEGGDRIIVSEKGNEKGQVCILQGRMPKPKITLLLFWHKTHLLKCAKCKGYMLLSIILRQDAICSSEIRALQGSHTQVLLLFFF